MNENRKAPADEPDAPPAGPSPAPAAAQRWRGHLDLVEPRCIEGWAQDLDDPERPLLLRVLDNGIPIGDVRAERYREDLKNAGIGAGRHAFRLELPHGLAPGLRHVIEVRRADDGRALPGSPKTLEASAPAAGSTLQPERAAWRGNIELLSRDRIQGWAFDPQRPDEPLGLVILDNGAVIARVLANRYRPDLADAGMGNGRHGFSVTIPGGLSPLTKHVIQVIGEADGAEMPTSPALLAASGGFDEGLQSALNGAIAGLSTREEREAALNYLAQQMERLLQQSADADSGKEARLIRRQLERRWGKSPADEPAAASARALVIDDLPPAVDKDAGSIAILSHMRALQALGFEVSFVASAALAPDPDASAALEAQGVHCCRSPYYASVEELLRRQSGGFDLIYLHRVSNASKYAALARHHGGRTRVVYSVADLHHLRFVRQAEVESRPELASYGRRVRQQELMAASNAHAIITHSSLEAELLRKALPGCNVHVVPWAVPVRPVATDWRERRGVAFIGSFGHAPNPDAARFLVQQVMPRVWREDPSIRCLLVGSGMDAAIQRLAGPGIDIVGQVPDLASVFERVRLTAAPLRFGAGLKGKVLESFAAGLPCVMSPVAAEGLLLPEALAAAVGDDADAIAVQIIRLHADREAAQAASAAALALVAECFNEARVRSLLQAVVEGRRAPTA